jgi:hypothetical protein
MSQPFGGHPFFEVIYVTKWEASKIRRKRVLLAIIGKPESSMKGHRHLGLRVHVWETERKAVSL